MRLIREHDKKSPDNYRLADGSLDLVHVRSDFANGYTIVLDDVEQYVRPIASLAHGIEVELNFATKVNAYVTPPESQGFVAHYDGHDVLILQIQGSKIWHLYDGADVPPHQLRRAEKWVAAGLPSPTDLRLEVGDVLYLPRGRVHAAEATSEPSVHLTVGIHAPTALTFAVAALNSLSFSDDRLNARLPPRHLDDADARATLGVLLRDAVRTVEYPPAVAGGLDALADTLVHRGQCPPVGQVSNAIAIDGQTVVRKYQPLYSRVTAVNDGVTLQFAQLSITASSDHKAAMPAGMVFHLSRCGSTLVSRLMCTVPGVVVIAEPAPLNALLRLDADRVDETALVRLVRLLVRVLGRCRHGDERQLVLKCTSWNIGRREVLAAAFPEAPWVWVQRDPVRVLASLFAEPPGWLGLQGRPHGAARLFGPDPAALPAMSCVEFAARVLGAILDAATTDPGRRLLIDYADLPGAVWQRVAPHFGLEADAAAIERHDRGVSLLLQGSSIAGLHRRCSGRRPATDEMREAAQRFAEPGYRALASRA